MQKEKYEKLSKRDRAKWVLRHYIRELSKSWSEQHDTEIFQLVDDLIDATKEEVKKEILIELHSAGLTWGD